MALLESTSHRARAAAVLRAIHQPKRLPQTTERPHPRLENLREVGTTTLTLILVAIGIVALRYVLVLAYGLLH